MKKGRSAFQFPPAWLWLVDEAIPAYVKEHYSPRDSWKFKPFSKDDAIFFSKGIEELSEIFTEERSKIQNYFNHPRFRSAYLLYFLPLQAAKFLSLFSIYEVAMEKAVESSKKSGVLRVLDLGSGPGTASLAVTLWLLARASQNQLELPTVELTLVDTNLDTLRDGKALLDRLALSFPRLRGKLEVKTVHSAWWAQNDLFAKSYSLIVMGHVLNESTLPQGEKSDSVWSKLLHASGGAGLLMVEPASRSPSQHLSRLRDRLIQENLIEADAQAIWGPCLHAEACPLADGRDWCHFSMPVEIPGDWFKSFSRALSSERQWVKFSYLWLASTDHRAPKPQPEIRRVVSDALSHGPGPSNVLLCEPEVTVKWPVADSFSVHRGDLIRKTVVGAPRPSVGKIKTVKRKSSRRSEEY